MSYELDIRLEPDHLHVQATGIRSISNIVAMARDCLEACDKHGCKKLLIDVQRMTGALSAFDAFDLGTRDLGKLRRGRQLKAAVVDLEENRTRFAFLETVLHNRGMNVRFFSSAADAERWLGEVEGSPGKPDGE
jgi:hypothetical protein